ncbi:UbiD family decarboxylase [Streptomyces pathocidini]|uniref:UbiD family decarboxylase n=1 Tax=Streptomyces pathocidini TaxID=1650571 RepID=UPI0033E3A243
MKRIPSLRAYLDALDDLGDLRILRHEVDPELELGATVRRAYETRAPAPLFERVRGAAPGFRVLGAPAALCSRADQPFARLALSLGLPPRSTARDIMGVLSAAHDRPRIPPREVARADAPCKENVLLDDAVDLGRFPAPLLHDGDGGRYFNTWGTVVAATPDGSWTNWAVARAMVLDRRRMTGAVVPTQHLGMIHRQWAERGQPMPFALAQGCEPGVPIVSGMPFPAGVDEADVLGGLFGEPVDVVRCETVPLSVPATAEIVVEGHLSHEETAPEGPMGEYAGYLSGAPRPQPVYRVTAITHRNDPILPVVVAGQPVDEDHTVSALTAAAECLRVLRAADLPVEMAWVPLETAGHWCVVTVRADWRQRYGSEPRELTRRIAELVLATRFGAWMARIIVVDDDVDATDLGEVVWAFATRGHPRDGLLVFDAMPLLPLMVCYTAAERMAAEGPKLAHNCLLPAPGPDRPRRCSFEHNYPTEIRRRVLEREE